MSVDDGTRRLLQPRGGEQRLKPRVVPQRIVLPIREIRYRVGALGQRFLQSCQCKVDLPEGGECSGDRGGWNVLIAASRQHCLKKGTRLLSLARTRVCVGEKRQCRHR